MKELASVMRHSIQIEVSTEPRSRKIMSCAGTRLECLPGLCQTSPPLECGLTGNM